MKTTTVTSNNALNELLFVCLTALVVISLSGVMITVRLRTEQKVSLERHQISVFEELGVADQGVFNDLYAAALEIIEAHETDEDEWIAVKQLESDYISPFVHDLAWKKRGRISWHKKNLNSETKHTVLYMGKPSVRGGTGSFLLVCLHEHRKAGAQTREKEHAPFEIWYHKSTDVDLPQFFSDQLLITGGWKEVVAYKGEDEVIRLKGKEYL